MISSLTLSSSKPRSDSDKVTWRMISSKHCEKSSSRTGQMPDSRAYLSISFESRFSLRRATSTREAGVCDTYEM